MKIFFKIVCLLLSVTASIRSVAQTCDSKYLSEVLKVPVNTYISKLISNSSKELVAVGYSDESGNTPGQDYNGLANVAKFTRNGTPVWSYQYRIAYFSYYPNTFFLKLRLWDGCATSDGGTLIAGEILREKGAVLTLAILAKLDKYGTVVWAKSYEKSPEAGSISFSNVMETSDGDVIAYMAIDNGKAINNLSYSYNRILRFSSSGLLKWSSLMYSAEHDASGLGFRHRRGLTQLRNGNILIADIVYKATKEKPVFAIKAGNIRYIALDYSTGKKTWESSTEYTIPSSDPFFVPDINHLSELPDGRISLASMLYLPTAAQPILTKKPVTIIADNQGNIQKVVTYSSPGAGSLVLRDVSSDGATDKAFLFNRDNLSTLSTIDAEGAIKWTKGYDNPTGKFPPNAVASSGSGYGIFMSDFADLFCRLLVTDPQGIVQCANVSANVTAETVPYIFPVDSVITTTVVNGPLDIADNGYPFAILVPFPMLPTVECEQVTECCKDVIDTVNISTINICEGSSYKLPDNSLVSDSGKYYVTFKTAGGCDSVKFYNINVLKDPAHFQLGRDTCLLGSTSLLIKGTPGFDSYNWMGTQSPTPEYSINAPGIYWAKVMNQCGSKTDSIEVFDQCDFEIYMPTAFTPNGDGLNDYFRIPPSNKNRVLQLTIYNRWGQIVFQTNTEGKGWDGKLNKQPLDSGVFIYYLRMQGLSGTPFIQKGTVLLVR